jgi:hypothetical protein
MIPITRDADRYPGDHRRRCVWCNFGKLPPYLVADDLPRHSMTSLTGMRLVRLIWNESLTPFPRPRILPSAHEADQVAVVNSKNVTLVDVGCVVLFRSICD